jgi:hypothetical protein
LDEIDTNIEKQLLTPLQNRDLVAGWLWAGCGDIKTGICNTIKFLGLRYVESPQIYILVKCQNLCRVKTQTECPFRKNPESPVFSRCRASPPYAFSLYAFLGFVKGVFWGGNSIFGKNLFNLLMEFILYFEKKSLLRF